LADKMSKQGKTTSTTHIYENYLRPLTKQGVINSVRSVINGKENLYYPVNQENESKTSILPLTEDCRLIINNQFDEKNVLEESFKTLIERRSNGGGVKYKIIDTDDSEITLTDLLERYFFSENHYPSCSVIETKLYNNVIEESSMAEQIKDSKMENLDEENELFHQQEAIKKSYECYYCDKFDPTDNRDDYEKHVVLSHDGKLAYPSKVDLEKNNLKPQGKEWEI